MPTRNLERGGVNETHRNSEISAVTRIADGLDPPVSSPLALLGFRPSQGIVQIRELEGVAFEIETAASIPQGDGARTIGLWRPHEQQIHRRVPENHDRVAEAVRLVG